MSSSINLFGNLKRNFQQVLNQLFFSFFPFPFSTWHCMFQPEPQKLMWVELPHFWSLKNSAEQSINFILRHVEERVQKSLSQLRKFFSLNLAKEIFFISILNRVTLLEDIRHKTNTPEVYKMHEIGEEVNAEISLFFAGLKVSFVLKLTKVSENEF